MLENEPEGGEQPDVRPLDATPESTEAAPVRRVRATRRRSAAAVTPPEPAGEAAEPAPAPAAAEPSPAAPPAADSGEDKPKVTRRRRTAVTREKAPEALEVPETPAEPAQPVAAGEATVPPVKVTRTRRKKAVPAAEAAPAEIASAGGETPAEPAAAEPPASATPAQTAAADAPVQAQPAAASDVPPADETTPDETSAKGRRRRAAVPPPVLFMAPEPDAVLVVPAAAVPAVVTEEVAEVEAETAETSRRRRRSRKVAEPVVEAEPEVEPEADAEDQADEGDIDDEDDETAAARRRRRRGRRGRGRGKGGADDFDEDETDEPAAAEAEAEAETDEDETDGDGVTRRRRRRRRKGAGDVDADTAADDGVPTVVKVREPRKSSDEVQGVSGSTRLEAKRQRRRDGREQRRTKPPILSESEFLARREAVDRRMVIRQRGDRTQIAVLEDEVLVEHYVTRNSSGSMAGNVYLGKVQNVLPSMEAAFVDVGRGRNAVLYAGEVNWDSSGLEGRARSIEQALKSGDSVLVQVTKEPIGHKGARLTSHIALSGRHLVYVPHGNTSGISRKLPDNERKRLRDVLKKMVPDGAGVIVRTAAEGASEDDLARDIKRLQAQWDDIQAKATSGGAPALLYEEPDLVIRVVRDLFNEDFRELVVQGEESYAMVESYLSHVSPDLVERLHRYTGVGDVFTDSRIDEQLLKALDRKVFLPSGGSLVIDRTEAMTVVDVNTGKYTGTGGNLEETVTRNNLEAAEEIVRQLRLRDIGGIVVIDFIDMVLESNRELVLRRLTECLGRDRTKHQVTEITSLGLVQMTRKRIGAGLLEAFSETCECCKGRGVIIHTEPVADKTKPATSEKVKVVTATATAPEQAGAGSRRRGRKGAAERTVAEVAEVGDSGAAEPIAAVAVLTEDDTMGYDLSRYETDTVTNGVASAEADRADAVPLAGADDPDGLAGDEESSDEGGGRRRARRGTGRRRTRS